MQSTQHAPTINQALFTAQDFALILTAIRERKAEMEDALSLTGTRMPPSQEAVLRAVAMLPGLDERTRATVKQVLAFLPALGKARRTPEAAAALAALDRQISRAGSVDEVAAGLGLFGNDLRFDKVSGLAVGVNCALEMVRTAEFGAERPEIIARSCASSAVGGALRGALAGVGPIVGALVCAIAGSAWAAIVATAR